MSALNLHTVLERRGPAAAIVLSDEQVASLGSGKAVPVVVSFGERSIRLRLARMGGQNLIGFSKAARADAGVEIGDEIDVTITVDSDERAVEIPPALAQALDADPAARAAFDALAPSRRKEMARQITEAKQDATRQRRLEKALDTLRG
ncbi:antitoxin component of MazEF toxin-antitoxin module [Microbacterium ginsengiterrae]|uniref:Antitoxin component of MazEF toxin-antitoxin module n=1 Tax=Microbacterium ginsengiterrae TaxID=546115 RepID=A0A7W9FCB7_9MICO|nr:YdeI/OmpD-associated family protein [Microbacterium ginsengiterrae]MBB5742318.1 antitoxin component of MazEF toxin-antitoxin module [Microbacterium ginsengiterrae]